MGLQKREMPQADVSTSCLPCSPTWQKPDVGTLAVASLVNISCHHYGLHTLPAVTSILSDSLEGTEGQEKESAQLLSCKTDVGTPGQKQGFESKGS
jgi:hypothetical protein